MPATICSFVTNPASGGKFIVLVDDANPESGTVVFSDFTRDFQHHDILMRWQNGNGGATPQAKGLSVAGGGWWRMEGAMLVVYGQSAAFGRFDPNWVRGKLRPGFIMNETSIDVL